MPLLLSALFAVAAPAAAPVLRPADLPDARCLGAFAILASTAKGDQLDFARVGVFYYLGRLDARHPGIDLETAMREILPAIVSSNDAELKRCSEEFGGVAGRLSTAGDALQK